jgi:hypothetical protein
MFQPWEAQPLGDAGATDQRAAFNFGRDVLTGAVIC